MSNHTVIFPLKLGCFHLAKSVFFCDEHKLVIELDGAVHSKPQQAKKGKTRDAYFRSMGMTVLRLSNKDCTTSTERALRQIASACNPPSPLGRGMGGEGPGLRYVDIPRFYRSATLDDIRKHGHVLTPGRYVGAEEVEDDGEPFGEKMQRLVAQLRERQAKAARLDAAIAANLKELGYGE
jgi:type I restriction-modification system DNA methylase subunit